MFVLLTVGGAPAGLVLVLAATRSEMALRSVFGKQNVEFLDV